MFKIDFKKEETVQAYNNKTGIFSNYELFGKKIDEETGASFVIFEHKTNDLYMCVLTLKSGLEEGFFVRDEELDGLVKKWLINWFSYETDFGNALNFFTEDGEREIYDFEVKSFEIEDEEYEDETEIVMLVKKDDIFGLISPEENVISKDKEYIYSLYEALEKKLTVAV